MDRFTFCHLGDPQIGMGEGGAAADAARLRDVIDRVNDLDPAFVLVAGDLTDRRSEDQHALLASGLAGCRAPLHLLPGNHDIFDSTDLEGLALYRGRYGPDRWRFALGRWEFLGLNSMLLDATTAGPPEMLAEADDQWAWIDATLRSARAAARSAVLAMHVPPFLATEDEPHKYFNLPRFARERLLATVRRFGVRTVLTGHTHTTVEIETESFTLYTTAGSAVALDDRGAGFRVCRADGDRLEIEYRRL